MNAWGQEFQALRDRVERRARLRRRVECFCLGMSLVSFLYFAGQLARAVLP